MTISENDVQDRTRAGDCCQYIEMAQLLLVARVGGVMYVCWFIGVSERNWFGCPGCLWGLIGMGS